MSNYFYVKYEIKSPAFVNRSGEGKSCARVVKREDFDMTTVEGFYNFRQNLRRLLNCDVVIRDIAILN